jgi:hypothetical protein
MQLATQLRNKAANLPLMFGSCNMKLGFKIRLVLLFACALCLVVLLLIAVLLWPQPKASGLGIKFVGFTNALGQPQSAVFGVTNLSHRTIGFVTPEPQVRTGGNWSEIVFAGPGKRVELAGGQVTNVTMTVPSRGEAWRMPIIWFYQLSTLDIYVHRSKDLLSTAKEGSLSGWKYGFALTSYTNFSAEMELTKAEDGAANGSQPFRSETNQTSGTAGSGR